MSKYKLCYIYKFCKLNVIKIIYLINYICLKNICLQNYLLGKKLNKLIEFNKKKKTLFTNYIDVQTNAKMRHLSKIRIDRRGH